MKRILLIVIGSWLRNDTTIKQFRPLNYLFSKQKIDPPECRSGYCSFGFELFYRKAGLEVLKKF